MKIHPIGERLVLRSIKSEATTISGIIIPDGSKEKPVFAEIISISKDLDDKSFLKIGDKVIYTKFKGSVIKDNDEEYIVIDLQDILAIVEE